MNQNQEILGVSRINKFLHLNRTLPSGTPDQNSHQEMSSNGQKLRNGVQKLSHINGIFLAIFSTLAITCSIYLVKVSKALNASDMATIQFGVQILFCLPLAFFYGQCLIGPKDSRKILVFRGLAAAISVITLYFSIKLISFTDSIIIRYSSPIVTAVFAYLFLKEKLNNVHFVSLVLSIIGLIFVIHPSFLFGKYGQPKAIEGSIWFLVGILLAIVSSFSAGSSIVFTKNLTNKNVHFTIIMFFFSLTGFIISIAISGVLFRFGTTHKNWNLTRQFLIRDISFALLAGLVNFLGHVSFTLAIAKENPNKIALLRSMDIFVAFLVEYLIFSIVPNWLSAIGALFVILAVSIIYIYKLIINSTQTSSQSSPKNIIKV
jgi:drug/metabolite transporter (DMT)-like permease